MNVRHSFTLHSRSMRHSSTFALPCISTQCICVSRLHKTALGSTAIEPNGSTMAAQWQPDPARHSTASPSSRHPAFTARRPFSNQTRRQVPSRSTLQSDLDSQTENALQGEEGATAMGGARFDSRGCWCWCRCWCWWLRGQDRVWQYLALPCSCFGWSCPCSRDGDAGAGVRRGGTLRAL
ncbi:hypothetical protein BC831DRAFT_441457, partial [Entophlyctis helioformis]